MKGGKRFSVGRRLVPGSTKISQQGVLGTNTRVVESGSKRMGVEHLSVLILQQGCHRSVEYAERSGSERYGVGIARTAVTGGLDTG